MYVVSLGRTDPFDEFIPYSGRDGDYLLQMFTRVVIIEADNKVNFRDGKISSAEFCCDGTVELADMEEGKKERIWLMLYSGLKEILAIN